MYHLWMQRSQNFWVLKTLVKKLQLSQVAILACKHCKSTLNDFSASISIENQR